MINMLKTFLITDGWLIALSSMILGVGFYLMSTRWNMKIWKKRLFVFGIPTLLALLMEIFLIKSDVYLTLSNWLYDLLAIIAIVYIVKLIRKDI